MSPIDLSIFKLKLPVSIRFSDFDLLAHVNNATFLTYLEEARIQYFATVIGDRGVDWRQEGLILARIEIDFRKPITGYQNYFVNLRVSRLGNKSFDFEYAITCEEKNTTDIVATAKSVMVCFDYRTNKTIEIRKNWKEKVIEFEPAII